MVKIVIDAGHGLNTSGKETPDKEKEWSFNNKVVLALIAKLNTYQDVQILRVDDPTGKTDVPLITRTNKAIAFKGDVYISCHHNAFQGKWGSHTGVVSFIYNGANKSYGAVHKESIKVANAIHPLVVKAMGLYNRGIKTENFHVLREVNKHMPSVLVEGGFMDSTIDIKALRSDAKLKAQGEAIAEGLASYFKLKPKSNNQTPSPKEMYRVRKSWADVKSQIGAFTELANAKDLVDKNTDYKVYNNAGKEVYSYKAPETYRVRKTWADDKSQIGAFTVLQNAKDLADKNKGYSVFNNAGTNIYTPKVETPKPEPKPEPPKQEINNPIMGKSQSTVEQMIAFVEKNNPNAKNLREIALSFLEVGEKYGIRGDVAYCQSIIETGWFRFDGGTAVTYDQHNYCGLGVVSKGVKGHSFATVKEGVTAQIQHLYAYANKDNLPSGEILVDPRFKYVTRGIAPCWEDLSNRWAMNTNYGSQILSMYDNLLKQKVENPVNEKENNVNDLIEAFSWALKDKEAQSLIYDLWKRRK